MRPIRLEFAGLHSYRERQVIDFAELLGGGLFGIFGPTGSGKSTILDAITLALYGRVERADRGTVGIMNQNERRLEVKFTFALGGEAVYRVERSYRRDRGTESIRSEHCRLVECKDGAEVPLADRERDVTARVTEILGLEVEDFTRAVVLPQGQFAEFLHLTGRQRTEMLQRIFGLAQYGDRLNERLKRRLDAVGEQLLRVESEQAGLGEASAEAVARAEAHVRELEAAAAAAERELAELEAQFRTWERVWELQQELSSLHAALAHWQAGEPMAAAWRQELALARRAERVRLPLEALQQARAQSVAAARRLEAAEASAQAARNAEAEAVAAHLAARERRETEAPGLMERRSELQRAAALESGLAALRQRADDAAQRAQAEADRGRQIAAQIEAGERHQQEAAAAEAGLRQRLAAVEVDGEHRRRIYEARRRLERLQEAERAAAEAERRLLQRKAQAEAAARDAERSRRESDEVAALLAGLEQEIERLEAERPADEEELRAEASWLSRAEEQIRAVQEAAALLTERRKEAERWCEEASSRTAAAGAARLEEERARGVREEALASLEQAQARLEEVRLREQAATLRLSLREGEPCPVCGSREHPHASEAAPAEAHTAGVADVAEARAALAHAEAALRQAERRLEAAVRQRAEAEGAAATAQSRVEEAEKAVEQAEAGLSAARSRLPEAWREIDTESLPAACAREAEEHARRRERYLAWQESLARMRHEREELSRRAGSASAEALSREATRRAAGEALCEAEAALAEQREALAGRRSEFDEVRGEMDAEAIVAAQRKIDEADRESAELRRSLEALRQEQQALEQDLAARRRAQQQHLEALHGLQVEQAQARQRLAESEAEWHKLTGGTPAGPQLEEVVQRLQELDAAEAHCQKAREEAERHRSQAEQELAAAREAYELGSRRLEEADAVLAEALRQSGFAGAEAAAAALRPEAEQSALEARIRAHEQEGDRLNSRREELQRQLDGRSLTAGEWQAWQERREAVRAAAGARREERARAQQVLEDLQAKQQRWQELEAQRNQLRTSKGHLEELKSLLRGNALVDFLAEEQMARVAALASLRLGELSWHRYALEREEGGGFVIRDDMNGGARRSVKTLSGGETFLTSLALALALSTQIQLRGDYPLEFFFLDEGFGTLDPELLDLVISTLERLHFEKLHVGVISHVAELRARIQRRVIVEPAEPGGRGSRIRLERA